MPTVFLNGEFVERGRAWVSAFDAGFQHGVGLFETLTACRRGERVEAVHLPEHVSRIVESARALGLSDALRAGALEEAIDRTLEKAASDMPGVSRFRVRLTLTGGDLNMLEQGRGGEGSPDQEPTVLIVVSPATHYPPEMFARGVAAMIADWKANPLDPFQGHKTLNYWPRLRELQRAAGHHASESIVFQVTNHVASGCVSNLFLVREGELLTPIARGEEQEVAIGDEEAGTPGASDGGAVIPSPVLPGIARRWVMDWALSEGIEVRRRLLTIHDLLESDEVFLTNSSWGVLPVVRIEAEAVGRGGVGGISARLVGAWKELMGG